MMVAICVDQVNFRGKETIILRFKNVNKWRKNNNPKGFRKVLLIF